MTEITFEELVKAVRELSREQKFALIQTLEPSFADLDDEPEPTREQLIAELEALRAADAFKNVVSLRNIYATPDAATPSEEELNAYLREIGTAWEQELDELANDTD